MLIDVEGIDGVGKTTQCILLQEWLSSLGHSVVSIKESSGTEFGKQINKAIHSQAPRNKIAEMYAFLSAKAQIYAQVVLPQLALECQVISDRGQGSFLSYHSIKTGLGVDVLLAMMNHATLDIQPGITILIDMPADIAIQRNLSKKTLTKFDKMSKAFFEEQRKIFLQLSTSLPNWIVVNGALSIDEVFSQIKDGALPFIAKK